MPVFHAEYFILAGIIVNAYVSIITSKKASVIHDLVNSQFSQAKSEIAAATTTIAILQRQIADLTHTIADRTRAEVAEVLASKPPALPTLS